MVLAEEIIENHRLLSVSFGSEPLLIHPDGRTIDLATGYIPLLSTFTTEDKAAKGLRKGKETSSQPKHFSLLDLVRDNQVLLLSGPIGSGKSTFAKHLCYSLANQDHQTRRNATASNETSAESKQWDTSGLQPFYFVINDAQDLEALACDLIPTLLASLPESTLPGFVVVIDALENSDERVAENIDIIATQILASANNRHRLLFLRDSGASDLVIPPAVINYNIKSLSVAQRRRKIEQLTNADPATIDFGLGDAVENPALFALALQAKLKGDQPEPLLDAWLAIVANKGELAGNLEDDAFRQTCQEIRHVPAQEATPQQVKEEPPLLASSRKFRYLLAARHLSTLSVETAVKLFQHSPIATAEIIRSLLTRLVSSHKLDELAHALLQTGNTTSQRSALLLARAGGLSPQLEDQIRRLALDILENGQLPLAERQEAASVLSRSGDPRDLTGLAKVPAGMITLGSNTHPNSQPMHEISVDAFRIGVFPVTVKQYGIFANVTRRQWISPDSHDLHKQNFPATEVTWHDAVAYCEWLTIQWRANGTISESEHVRLPSEPEWEKAASGGRNKHGLEQCLYPWGAEWHSDASNCEETGVNQPCAVGLFLQGRSSYGCHDMVGNIWEWCTTLWGEDMATPSFGYPWRDDGREAAEASPSLRRVLRGGCFSSGRLKANCTYRGSLEPAGYWRGNGFRIVVAPCS